MDSSAPSLLGQMCRTGESGGNLGVGERVGQGNFIWSWNKHIEWFCASTPDVFFLSEELMYQK